MWWMDRYKLRGRGMRLLALGMFVLGLTASYLLVLRHFRVSELPGERYFAGPVKPAGDVYFEPIGIDALNDAMQMRVYLSPSVSDSKSAAARVQNLTLLVTHDKTVEEVKLAASDQRLIARGAQGIVLGCTEIMLLTGMIFSVPMFGCDLQHRGVW
jgi:hypothetical protein